MQNLDLETMVEEGERVYNIHHRCFHFSKSIIAFVRGVKIEKLLFSIYEQLIRSATSIGANVVEAKAESSKRI